MTNSIITQTNPATADRAEHLRLCRDLNLCVECLHRTWHNEVVISGAGFHTDGTLRRCAHHAWRLLTDQRYPNLRTQGLHHIV